MERPRKVKPPKLKFDSNRGRRTMVGSKSKRSRKRPPMTINQINPNRCKCSASTRRSVTSCCSSSVLTDVSGDELLPADVGLGTATDPGSLLPTVTAVSNFSDRERAVSCYCCPKWTKTRPGANKISKTMSRLRTLQNRLNLKYKPIINNEER